MTSLLADLTRDKRILLLGFGKEGRSTYKLLKEICTWSVLDIADIALEESIPGSVVYSGENYMDSMEQYDIVFKSPGIVLPKDCREFRCVITTQTEVFLKAFRTAGHRDHRDKGKHCIYAAVPCTPYERHPLHHGRKYRHACI